MQATSGIKWICENPEELPGIARQLLAEGAENRVFAFFGAMGAGKTTLIKEVCRQLGAAEMVASPTFTILNEYRAGNEEPIYHFDFYRIKSESEAFDLGFENYLYSGNYCFIEWPEKIANLLPLRFARVTIEVQGEKRVITLTL